MRPGSNMRIATSINHKHRGFDVFGNDGGSLPLAMSISKFIANTPAVRKPSKGMARNGKWSAEQIEMLGFMDFWDF